MELDQDHNGRAGRIRVIVADNSRFHTQLLAEALRRDPNLQVVCSDLNAPSVLAASSGQTIDVFVLSAFAEEHAQRGFRILEELRKRNPRTRAVMVLDSSNPDSIVQAFRAGARGIFDHHESLEMLCRCILRVHEGQLWLNNEQIELVLDSWADAPKVRAVDGSGMNLLSKRETEVVRSLAEGLTNREIAQRMGLSKHTIKNYLFRIFDKLGVSNRIELLFMTLSQSTASPPLVQGLLNNMVNGCDPATFALCRKAAEHGVVAAQLGLAASLWKGRENDRDVISSYVWFCVAIEQLTQTKTAVMKAMNPAQLAEAECQVRERLDKSRRIEPSPSTQASLAHARSIRA